MPTSTTLAGPFLSMADDHYEWLQTNAVAIFVGVVVAVVAGAALLRFVSHALRRAASL